MLSKSTCYIKSYVLERLFREGASSLFKDTITNRINVLPRTEKSYTRQSGIFKSSSRIILEVNKSPLNSYNVQRCFNTSLRRNALPPLPPLIAVIIENAAKYGPVLVGRFARNWWRKLPQERKVKYFGRVRKHQTILLGLLSGLGLGAFVYCYAHVQEVPLTNRKRFVVFNDDQFNEIARYQLQLLLDEYEDKIIPVSMRQAAYKRVVRVARRLLNGNRDLNQIHDKEWTITVVKDDAILNAFVLQCGSIFVYSGLLKLCETDDQLAIILGHEMAHAVLGHGSEKASFLHLLELFFIVPLASLWALIPTDVVAALSHWFVEYVTDILVSLPYNRSLEIEADQVGLVLAAKACFDVREAPVVWAKMGVWSQNEDDPDIEWLSTHPSDENRQAYFEELLPNAIETREACKCPKLPFKDPRHQIDTIGNQIVNVTTEKPKELFIHLKI